MLKENQDHLTSLGYEAVIFCLCNFFFESALYLDGKSICRAEVACQKTRAGAHTRGSPHALKRKGLGLEKIIVRALMEK